MEIAIAVLVGLCLWAAGVSTLYSFLELVDALRPEKPDEKPLTLWALWLGGAIVLFPLVMLLGIFRLLTWTFHSLKSRKGAAVR